MKKMIITSLGSFVQWFDNTIFQVLVPLIIFNFVPKNDQLSAGFSLVMAYSASLFTRPFGAIIFGHLSDEFGRKKILLIAPFVMGMAMLCLSLCPSEKVVGVAAPAFLLLFTFLHGFSSGAEWTVSSCMMYEQTKSRDYPKCGLVLSGLIISGIFFADLIVAMILYIKSPEFIAQFSWRLIFLLSAVLSFGTLFLRRQLAEVVFYKRDPKKSKVFKSLYACRHKVGLAMLVCALEGIMFNVIFNNFYPYADQITSRAMSFVAISFILISAYALYKITKFLGVIKTMKLASLAFAFLALVEIVFPSHDYMLIVKILYAYPAFMFLMAITTLLPSLFEETNRAFLVAVSRSISIFIFGGVGLISLKLWFPENQLSFATYTLVVAMMSFYAITALSRKKLDVY